VKETAYLINDTLRIW